jgi:hypothetical protein
MSGKGTLPGRLAPLRAVLGRFRLPPPASAAGGGPARRARRPTIAGRANPRQERRRPPVGPRRRGPVAAPGRGRRRRRGRLRSAGPEGVGAGAAFAASGAWKELVTLTVVLVGLSRFAEGPALWATAVLALVAHVFATLEVLGADPVTDDAGVPVEALLVPGVAAVAAIGALRLVPVGLLLVPALFAAGCLVLAAVVLERRVLGRANGATADDRAALLSLVLLVAFVAFAGIAAAIPGALVEPGGSAAAARPGLPVGGMILLAVADGLLAGLVGYRLAALRAPDVRGAVLAALSYAVVVAIAAAGIRAMAIPRLLGTGSPHARALPVERLPRWAADGSRRRALGLGASAPAGPGRGRDRLEPARAVLTGVPGRAPGGGGRARTGGGGWRVRGVTTVTAVAPTRGHPAPRDAPGSRRAVVALTGCTL